MYNETHVNIIRKVEPSVGSEKSVPFLNTTNHPDKIIGSCTHTIFQLNEIFSTPQHWVVANLGPR